MTAVDAKDDEEQEVGSNGSGRQEPTPLPAPGHKPQPEPVAPEIDATMRVSIYEGCATIVFLNWTAGAVLTGFMIHYGATPIQLGLITSLPLLAQVSAPFAAWLYGVFPRRKVLVTGLAIAARSLWTIPLLAPFFVSSSADVVKLTLMTIAIGSFFQGAAGVVWQSWMGDIVPPDRRGRYFGLRNGIHAVVNMTSGLAAGLLLDRLPTPLNYKVILGLALVFAAVGIFLYLKHYEPPAVRHPISLRDIFALPLGDRNFRRFLVFAFYWQGAVLLSAPFVYPYFIDHLKLSFTEISIWFAIASGSTLITSPLWGRLADRVGNKPVLMISTVLAGSLLPLSWMAARPGEPTMIWFSGFVDALCWGAINPAVFNLALATAKVRLRTSYLSLFAVATGVGGFLGGWASGYLLPELERFAFTISSFQWTGYHWLFLVSGLLRMQAWHFLKPVQETHAWTPREMWRAFRRFRLNGFPWR